MLGPSLRMKKNESTSLGLGHHWHASETPNDGPLLVVFGSPHQLKKEGPLLKKNFLDPRMLNYPSSQ